MLNVSNLIKILLVLSISISLFASENLEKYEMNGININMSKENISKKLNIDFNPRYIAYQDAEKNWIDSNIINYYYGTKVDGNKEWSIYIDRNGKVFNITKHIKLKLKPNTTAIIEQLTSKYGKPSIKNYIDHGNSDSMDLCWGKTCYIKKSDYSRMHGTDIFQVIITNSVTYNTDINFRVLSGTRKKSSDLWARNTRDNLTRKSIKKLKEEEAKLDL